MKIEQIAIATENTDQAKEIIENLKKIGLTDWVEDTVTAQGTVFGKTACNKALLNFNYQLGFELEILTYLSGDNWHKERSKTQSFPFQSHLGLHVERKELVEIKERMALIGCGIAQEVYTLEHTNPVIAGKRKYHYIVFDSREKFGFDLKLIERMIIG